MRLCARSFVAIAFALVAGCAFSTIANAGHWGDTFTQADWGDHDWSCSPGAAPNPQMCDSAHVGQVAVCWPHRPTGECGGAEAWCTYKTVHVDTPRNGTAPGEVYQCQGD